MKFLEDFNFRKEDIDEFINNTPKDIAEAIKDNKELVESNIDYLKGLGTNAYIEIFIDYPDMFFLDHSTFKEIFEKYETDSLIEKLNKNHKIVEYL